LVLRTVDNVVFCHGVVVCEAEEGVLEACVPHIVQIVEVTEQVGLRVFDRLVQTTAIQILPQEAFIGHVIVLIDIVLWRDKAVEPIGKALLFFDLVDTKWALQGNNVWCEFNIILQDVLVVI